MQILSDLLGAETDGRPFAALVSPAVRKLYGPRAENLNGFLRAAGAAAVYPVDAGIAEYARSCARAVAASPGGLRVLSACPATRPFMAREFPGLAARVLDLPSPMALRARAAIAELGLGRDGFALALSPCRYKKLERNARRPETLVLGLGELLESAEAAGVDLLSWPAAPYDEPVPPDDLCTRIAAEVGRELEALGLRAETVSLEGLEAAAEFLKAHSLGRSGDADVVVAELSFCRGGCAVDLARAAR